MANTTASLNDQTTREMINGIALASHCQAGATVALSGALAVALGQATANGSLQEGVSGNAATAARNLQTQLTEVRERLLALADQDATAIGEFVRLREGGQALQGYQLLCDGPREIAELALHAVRLLQDYRPHVSERTHDDLEFAITLTAAAARGAMQLLDSNLRIWPLPELLAKYGQVVDALDAQIDALAPVRRIRG
jgi:hypothetical protein